LHTHHHRHHQQLWNRRTVKIGTLLVTIGGRFAHKTVVGGCVNRRNMSVTRRFDGLRWPSGLRTLAWTCTCLSQPSVGPFGTLGRPLLGETSALLRHRQDTVACPLRAQQQSAQCPIIVCCIPRDLPGAVCGQNSTKSVHMADIISDRPRCSPPSLTFTPTSINRHNMSVTRPYSGTRWPLGSHALAWACTYLFQSTQASPGPRRPGARIRSVTLILTWGELTYFCPKHTLYRPPHGHHRAGTQHLCEIKGNAKARHTRKPTKGAAGRNADSDVAWEYELRVAVQFVLLDEGR
jgi:hypothetical protein